MMNVEVFVNGGEPVITFLIFPNTQFDDLQFHSSSGTELVRSLHILPMAKN
ncbi:hypothetical protein DET49_112113 [Salegentibacter sp. 24]|uniref:GH32 C-terminal domain-containing protein n=1 Tax=Salegentibacter sp. 24 TaxID=2183986 RepID=UPI0010EC5B58|nr:GH32 C-terminal domain-containing protein [Salegentibacter sp. 24]TDN87423.1 hypothetical protein DET49_112113 [Salegentibacter sp. 24]